MYPPQTMKIPLSRKIIHNRSVPLKPWSPTLKARISRHVKLKRVQIESRKLIDCCISKAQLTVTWMLICLCGNFYQVYHLSSQYFAFSISTNVQLVVNDPLEVPTMTLCFELPQVVLWDKMTHEERVSVLTLNTPLANGTFVKRDALPGYAVQKENGVNDTMRIPKLFLDSSINWFTQWFITANLQKMNLSYLFEVTKSHLGIIKQGSMFFKHFDQISGKNVTIEDSYVPLETRKDFEAAMDVKTFLKDKSKCYSLDVKQEYRKVPFYTIMRQAIVPGMLSYYKIYNQVVNTINTFYYILTPNGRTTRSGFYSYVPLSPQLGRSFKMTYDSYEAHLLPPPFETKCIEYQKLGKGSRGDCYEKCLRRKLSKINGLVPQGVNIYPGEVNGLLAMGDLWTNHTIKSILRQVEIKCDRKCHAKDCVSIFHIPKKLTTSKTAGNTYLINIAPQSPTVKATCLQMLTLTQFLTDLVSTFGFWLGISALGIFRFLKRSAKVINAAYIARPIERVTKKKQFNYPFKDKRVKSSRRGYSDKSLSAITPKSAVNPAIPIYRPYQESSLISVKQQAYDYLLVN